MGKKALSREELQALQNVELSILLSFDAYCRKHGLRYYLIGGALLGAARYAGFIPWDDDVDVAMPREDYERLRACFAEDPIGGLFLQNADTDPRFARGIQKLRKDGTEVIEASTKGVRMHQGIYIDIFPVDYLPALDAKAISTRQRKIRRLLSIRSIRSGCIGGRMRTLKRLLRVAVLFLSHRRLDRRLEALCVKDNAKERNYAILWTHNYDWQRQTHPISVLGTGGMCDFCGNTVMAPRDIHSFLTQVFGENYMDPPPPEKRVPPHTYISCRFE